MQVRKTNYLVNATPTFQVLTEDEIEAIYFSALTVLYETGVRVYDKEGVQVAFDGAHHDLADELDAAGHQVRAQQV